MTPIKEFEKFLQSSVGIEKEEMKILNSYFHREILRKGEFYLKAGSVCDKFSFQRSGLLRTYALHGHQEITQWISFKGNIVTDLSGIVFREPNRYFLQALTRCELLTISKADYDALPQVIARWPDLEKKLIARCYSFVETRVFGLLSMSARERYDAMMHENAALFREVPLKYLASMLGITPESLSRIRSRGKK